jgi:hypothetical protein
MSNRIGRIGDTLAAPAHSFTGRGVLEMVRRALVDERGYKMTLTRLARVIGKSSSTAGYWFNVREQHQVLAFVSVLERLSEPERHRLVGRICRVLPTVLHQQLAHAPGTVSDLLKLLAKKRGFSVIRGGSSVSRRFVLMALGHTFPQIDPHHRSAGGIDTHQPSKLVPCESLIYLRNPISHERARQVVREAWPEIQSSSAPLMLFNDVWSLLPELREEILNWAMQRHVVVADESPPERRQLPRKSMGPVHVLTLSHSSENPALIHVYCEPPQVRRRKTSV